MSEYQSVMMYTSPPIMPGIRMLAGVPEEKYRLTTNLDYQPENYVPSHTQNIPIESFQAGSRGGNIGGVHSAQNISHGFSSGARPSSLYEAHEMHANMPSPKQHIRELRRDLRRKLYNTETSSGDSGESDVVVPNEIPAEETTVEGMCNLCDTKVIPSENMYEINPIRKLKVTDGSIPNPDVMYNNPNYRVPFMYANGQEGFGYPWLRRAVLFRILIFVLIVWLIYHYCKGDQ